MKRRRMEGEENEGWQKDKRGVKEKEIVSKENWRRIKRRMAENKEGIGRVRGYRRMDVHSKECGGM